MRTAYIERPLEFGAGRVKDVSGDAGNDVHAGSLVGLAEKLEAGLKALLDCRSGAACDPLRTPETQGLSRKLSVVPVGTSEMASGTVS